MFKRVRNTLSVTTLRKQISWEHTSLSEEFFFNLSVGARIDKYSGEALSDNLFILDEAKTSHRLIRDLKSHTWPTQNSAIEDFTAAIANKASVNSLFVLGRNIYQAACGGSHGASGYLSAFVARAQEMKVDKRKALLDGMLFEVFYDPNAHLREEFKTQKFQDLFRLQQHTELSPSFEFIAECLLPAVDRFYSIPGKSHQVVVDVNTTPGSKVHIHVLESLHCCGASILRMEDSEIQNAFNSRSRPAMLDIGTFEQRLADQMLMPIGLLTINYLSFKKKGNESISFPSDHTVRKP